MKRVKYDSRPSRVVSQVAFLFLFFVCMLGLCGFRDAKTKAIEFLNTGVKYAEKGQYDDAILNYDQAIRLDPKLDKAYYDRGLSFFNKGQINKAIEDYTKAIELNRKYHKAYANTCNVTKKTSSKDPAFVLLNSAICAPTPKSSPICQHNFLMYVPASHPTINKTSFSSISKYLF